MELITNHVVFKRISSIDFKLAFFIDLLIQKAGEIFCKIF